MRKWYLCGPMSGHPEQNYPAFRHAARLLRLNGLNIVSPHETMHNPDGVIPWKDCLKADVKTLSECHGIILLEGWTLSRGARLEFSIAVTLEMEILTYYPRDLLRKLDGGAIFEGGASWNV